MMVRFGMYYPATIQIKKNKFIMRYIITQNYTTAHKELFDLTNNHTQNFAKNNGFEYIVSDKQRCVGLKANQHIGWEKIAWLMELLPTIEDNSLIIYADCDSVFLKGDLKNALNTGYEIGMVKLRGGLGGKEIINWFNTGVMVLLNTQNVRNMLSDIWNCNDMNEEIALKNILKSININIYSLDPKWNCWNNNEKLVSDPYIKTFHGMKLEYKIKSITDYLKSNKIA